MSAFRSFRVGLSFFCTLMMHESSRGG